MKLFSKSFSDRFDIDVGVVSAIQRIFHSEGASSHYR